MAAAGYSVRISAVDGATNVINRVNTGLEHLSRRVAGVRAPFERFNTAVGKLADNTGVTRLASGVSALSGRIAGAAESLGRFAPALAGITSVASIAGIASLVEHFTTFGSALGFAAQRADLTVDGLHDLQGAARIAGSSAEALTSGMTALGDNLTNAVAGRSAQTVQMMAALGLSFTDAFGHARAASLVLPEVADRIAALRNPTQQAMVATSLFGAAGESLLPFLRRGAAGIEEYNLQTERYGLVNDEGVRSANEMRMAQTRLRLAIEGAGYSIADKIAPVLVPLLDRLSNFIADNRTGIGDFFRDIAEGFKAWVDSGGLDRLIAGFRTVAEWVIKVGVGIERLISALLAIRLPSWIARILGIPASITDATAAPDAALPAGMGGWLDNHLPSWLGGHTSAPPLGPSAPDPTSAEQNARGRQAMDQLINLGWTPQQAAGIVSNIASESRFNPGAVGDSGQAAGLAQWHADRRAAILAGTGINVATASFEDQIRAIDWELRHTESGAGNALRNARTAANSGGIVSQLYERPQNLAGESAARAARSPYWERQWIDSTGGGGTTSNEPQRNPRRLPIHDDPSTWPAAPAVALAPAAGGMGGQGGPGANGRVVVRVDIPNAPPGVRATTIASGQGVHVEKPTLGNVP